MIYRSHKFQYEGLWVSVGVWGGCCCTKCPGFSIKKKKGKLLIITLSPQASPSWFNGIGTILTTLHVIQRSRPLGLAEHIIMYRFAVIISNMCRLSSFITMYQYSQNEFKAMHGVFYSQIILTYNFYNFYKYWKSSGVKYPEVVFYGN